MPSPGEWARSQHAVHAGPERAYYVDAWASPLPIPDTASPPTPARPRRDPGASSAARPSARTLLEVAADMQVTPRWLRQFITKHQIPVLRAGRVIRLDLLAQRALEEAMRPCPSPSPTVKEAGASSSPARSFLPMARGDAFAALLNLATRSSPGSRRRPSKDKCCATPGTDNVLALDPSRKRRSPM